MAVATTRVITGEPPTFLLILNKKCDILNLSLGGDTMTTINYTKVDENDAAVVQLAKETGERPVTIASMVNQTRYRQAYNKVNAERAKVIRRLIKEHPELLGEVKGGK